MKRKVAADMCCEVVTRHVIRFASRVIIRMVGVQLLKVTIPVYSKIVVAY